MKFSAKSVEAMSVSARSFDASRRTGPATRLARAGIGVAALAASAFATLPVTATSAQAGERYIRGDRVIICDDWGDCVIRKRHRPRHVKRHNDGDIAAAAILGILGGAIIAGALSEGARNHEPIYAEPVHPNYRAPSGHYPAAPTAPQPAPMPQAVDDEVITFAGSLEPWTPGWYAWCEDNYISFNAERGTFRGYDGKDHFCVPR